MIGIAIDKAYLEDENQTIGVLLPELMGKVEDERKQKITVKDILNQQTGLEWKGYLEHESWLNSEQPNLYVLNKKLVAEPNTVYNYNTGATHLLSVIIQQKSDMSALDFAKQFLFQPLGIDTLNWEKRGDGNYDGGGLGLEMRASDLVKIGQLVKDGGVYNDKQIVSKAWIDKLFDASLKSATDWGLRNSKHGYCWYQANFKGEVVTYAMGYGGQFILIVPEENIVVVSTFNHDTPNGIDQQIQFLSRNFAEILEQTKQDE